MRRKGTESGDSGGVRQTREVHVQSITEALGSNRDDAVITPGEARVHFDAEWYFTLPDADWLDESAPATEGDFCLVRVRLVPLIPKDGTEVRLERLALQYRYDEVPLSQDKQETVGDVIERVREHLREEIGETSEDAILKAFEPTLDMLDEGWHTIDPGHFADAAQAMQRLQDQAHQVLGGSTELLANAMGISTPDAEVVGSLAELAHFDIPGLVIGRRLVLIVGLLVGVATGNPVLTLACTKVFGHELVREFVKTLAQETFAELVGGPAVSRSSIEQPPISFYQCEPDLVGGAGLLVDEDDDAGIRSGAEQVPD